MSTSFSRAGVTLALVAAAGVIPAARAAAQTEEARNLWGYAIPESPAFTFLNASPAEVTRPARPRDLAFALANGLDSLGHVQQGIAIDVVPWPWIPGLRPNLARYQDRWWIYAAVNTGVSLGTVRSAGDSASTDVGLGIRTVLFDRSDPMSNRSFTDSLGARSAHCRAIAADTQFVNVRDTVKVTVLRDGQRDDQRVEVHDNVRVLPVHGRPPAAERAACNREAEEEWRKEWLRTHWNRASLGVAFALGSTLDQSLLSEARFRGFSAWASGAVPIGTRFQAVGQARLDHVRSEADADPVRLISAGLRAIWGSERVNAFGEVLQGWSNEESGTGSDPGTRWSAGVEFRAAEDLWLSTGFGKRFAGLQDDEQPVFLIANLRWNVATGPRIK